MQDVHNALADLIFMEGLPFKLVKSKYLRKFIDTLCKRVESEMISTYKIKAKYAHRATAS